MAKCIDLNIFQHKPRIKSLFLKMKRNMLMEKNILGKFLTAISKYIQGEEIILNINVFHKHIGRLSVQKIDHFVFHQAGLVTLLAK